MCVVACWRIPYYIHYYYDDYYDETICVVVVVVVVAVVVALLWIFHCCCCCGWLLRVLFIDVNLLLSDVAPAMHHVSVADDHHRL